MLKSQYTHAYRMAHLEHLQNTSAGSRELIDNSGGLNGASSNVFLPPFLSPSAHLVSAFHSSTLRHSARVGPRNSAESSMECRSEGGGKEKESERRCLKQYACFHI